METSQGPRTIKDGICPVSGTKGKLVDTATVKCLLNMSLTAVSGTLYYFCRDAHCPVVYFTSDGTQIFKLPEVRERVYQKEPDSDSVMVCYCFRYTLGDIRLEATKSHTSQIVEAINAGIRAGQCACDWRNPQGDCCLGNVTTLVAKFHAD